MEHGAPKGRVNWMATMAATNFLEAAEALESYDFDQVIGHAEVRMMPLGVVAGITPWNSNASFIAAKMAATMAMVAGCTIVIKPSEMSAIQTQVNMEALHQIGAPKGLFNIVTGRGDVVGAEFTSPPPMWPR